MVDGILKIRDSLKTGIGFGVTSGIITTVGLMVGLYSGTASKLAVVGGIISIAIVDAASDSLAIHVSEESKAGSTEQHVREATFSTLAAKFLVALVFLPAVLLLETGLGIMLNIVVGLGLVAAFSYYVAKEKGQDAAHTIFEHVGVGVLVILITYFVGGWVSATFS